MTEKYEIDSKGIRIDARTGNPRFSIDDETSLNNGLRFMEENGFAVFSGVISQEQIPEKKNLAWDFLENMPNSKIRRDDPKTWSSGWPGYPGTGVVHDGGIGQSDFMWSCRSVPGIRKVFSRWWKTNELLVSFDGCGIFRDWRFNPEWKTNSGWYHVDQNPRNKPNLCSVQGFLALTDQNERTGGLTLFPRSHLRFRELIDCVRRPTDFIRVTPNHSVLNRGLAIAKLIHCQAGDFVLFDSRIVHCNSPAFEIEKLDKTVPVDFLRLNAYITMLPLSFVQRQNIDQFRKLRKASVRCNQTHNHWSTEIANQRRTDGFPMIPYEKLTDYQQALVIGSEIGENE